MSKFQPIDLTDFEISSVMPDQYKDIFCDMGSLKSFMVSRIQDECRAQILKQINAEFNGIDYYES
jgi:hypothetical protein